jgi:hypothetical protein
VGALGARPLIMGDIQRNVLTAGEYFSQPSIGALPTLAQTPAPQGPAPSAT